LQADLDRCPGGRVSAECAPRCGRHPPWDS
jgi:hypothetical protein